MSNGKVIYYQNSVWVEFCALLANHCISFSTSTLKFDQLIKKRVKKSITGICARILYQKYLVRSVFLLRQLTKQEAVVELLWDFVCSLWF